MRSGQWLWCVLLVCLQVAGSSNTTTTPIRLRGERGWAYTGRRTAVSFMGGFERSAGADADLCVKLWDSGRGDRSESEHTLCGGWDLYRFADRDEYEQPDRDGDEQGYDCGGVRCGRGWALYGGGGTAVSFSGAGSSDSQGRR